MNCTLYSHSSQEYVAYDCNRKVENILFYYGYGQRYCLPPYMSGQFPEYRCFERTFGHDPEKQARAIQFLIGCHAVANFVSIGDPEKGKEINDSVAIIVSLFVERYPEFLEDGFRIKSDCGGEHIT